jgi:hypothetical protein
MSEQAATPTGRDAIFGTFPVEWGRPPLDSAARAGWILHNIELGRAARAAGEEVRWLHVPTPQEVQLHLIAHVESPGLAAARRAALLAVTKATGRLLDLEAQRAP